MIIQAKRQAEEALSNEKKFIEERASEIAGKEIKKVRKKYVGKVRKIRSEHKASVDIRNRFILFALATVAFSVSISILERNVNALNWIEGVNIAYLVYMVIQLLRNIKQRRE